MSPDQFSPNPLQQAHPGPRPMGRVNWRGMWSLYCKEVMRFMAVYVQTVAAPIVTTLLFLAIFSLALGRALTVVGGVPFIEFLAPGLIMMSIIQNSFANTSSSIVMSKMQGNIVDAIMAPLSPLELTIGYGLGGMTRGLVVGAVVMAGMAIFVPFHIHSLVHLVFYSVLAALMLSLLGAIGGIWAEKHEQSALLTNFVITPLAFLSGTFYSIDRLPGLWHVAARLNPFFYMIDGFRYGFTGHAEAPLYIGYGIMIVGNIGLGLICWAMFRSGYRLRT
ncbi:MAG: ABC transporter permease [Rhodospirillales bacterium]|jgi:ABC-2 type transport system permease protein|nr:ABC transporter permease [Rhodospirillales bacterium]MBT4006935.1 ABC transporter permease [Rhodospirillales bacterium]MBT5075181.1 ABC transporter permease [Rhodospirillales bacterium]MBT5113038.1 ABC transporter permease [Rhodospirillales bacterium]MBT6187591.1 ABC transporter permease [Rhodospirillales bacterium]